MRKFLLGVAGAAALTMGTAAPATVTVDPTTTVLVPVCDGCGTDIAFEMIYADGGLSNPFTETLTFTNTIAGFYDISLTTTTVNITSLFLSGATISNTDIPMTTLDPLQFGLNGLFLEAGTYTLNIGGGYSGSVSGFTGDVSFAAIPEPAVWGMMIIGFAGIGTAMRRRKLKPTVYFA